jgi:hypothetical protein
MYLAARRASELGSTAALMLGLFNRVGFVELYAGLPELQREAVKSAVQRC